MEVTSHLFHPGSVCSLCPFCTALCSDTSRSWTVLQCTAVRVLAQLQQLPSMIFCCFRPSSHLPLIHWLWGHQGQCFYRLHPAAIVQAHRYFARKDGEVNVIGCSVVFFGSVCNVSKCLLEISLGFLDIPFPHSCSMLYFLYCLFILSFTDVDFMREAYWCMCSLI